MSKRKDILDGKIIANLQKKYGLIYTCKAGWIDLGHLNPSNPRLEIGAENLWKQLKNERVTLNNPKCSLPRSGSSSIQVVAHFLSKPTECDTDSRFKFPDGKTGYMVRYRQDHAGYPGKPGREGRYVVKHGITEEQKKQVALAIFMEVSLRFENLQKLLSFATDSGYSQEDLISNLLGFYIGLGLINQVTALKLCHPVSNKTAYMIWDNEGAVGKIKNYNWTPKYAKSTYREDTMQCIDECILVSKDLPDEFKKIKPAIKGIFFKELF